MHITIHFLKQDHYGPKKISQHPSNSLRGFFVPRNYFDWFLDEYIQGHIKHHCIYFLLGKNDEGQNLVYIGETTDTENRINTHIKKRAWIDDIIMIELNQNYGKSILQYIEAHLIQTTKKYGRYKDDNQNNGFRVELDETSRDSADEMIVEISILLEVLGYDFLKPPIGTYISKEITEIIPGIKEYTISQPEAKGLFDGKKMTVLKGSKAKKDREGIANNNDVARTKQRVEKLRIELIENKIITGEGEYYVFQNDYEFNSASAAANFIMCQHNSGSIARNM